MNKSLKSLALFLALCTTAHAATTITDSSFSGSTNYADSVTFNLNNAHTYTGVVSGTNNTLTKTGSGVLTIGTTQTYTGATIVTGGTLKLADGLNSQKTVTLNGGTFSVNKADNGITFTVQKDGGTLDWRASGTAAVSVTLKGDSTTTANTVFTFNGVTQPKSNCNTMNVSANPTFSGKIKLAGGKWNVSNPNQLHSGSIILDGGTLMLNGTLTVANAIDVNSASSIRAGSDKTTTLTGLISGSGELGVSQGNGTIIFANSSNSFSGGLNLGLTLNKADQNATYVQLGADNALGTGPVTVTSTGTNLNFKGYSASIGGLSSTLTTADIKNSSTTTTSTLTLNVPTGKEYSYVGNLTGKINLVKSGAGTQILGTNAIAYTGTTTVTGGTLKLADGLNSLKSVTLNGGTFSVNKADNGITFTVQKDGGTLDWRASGTSAVSVALKGDGTTADTVFTFHGINNANGNCNTMNISSISNYSGKIRLTAGKWNLTGTGQLPGGSIILDGGTLMMNNGSGFTVPNAIEVASNSSIRPGGNPGVYKLTGLISGTGELGISGDNSTIVFANSSNSFSGGLNLGVSLNRGDGNYATVKLGANNALGTGLVTVSNENSRLDLAGYSVTTTPIAGLSTTLAGADIKNTSETTSTLTLNVASGKEYSYNGKLSGKMNLVKNGAGTQKLSGTGITFAGLVTVGGGTLDLSGATLSNLTGLLGSDATAILKNSNTTTTTNLTLNTASDQTYIGSVTGKISVTKTGSAKQTLDGSKLDTDFAAKISAGTLALTSCPATQKGLYTLDGGTLNLTGSAAVTLAKSIQTTTKGGTVVWNAAGTPGLTLGTLSGTSDANTVVKISMKDNASGNCPSLYMTVPSSYLGKVEIMGGKWVITSNVLPKAGIILSGGEIMSGDGTPDITQGVSLTAGTLSTLRAGFSKSLTVSGKITGAGQLGISTDSGKVIFTNSANDFSGGLVVGTLKNSNNGAGRLQAGAENVLGTGTLEVVSGATNVNEVNLNGFNQTAAGLISDGANAKVYDSTTTLADLTLDVPEGEICEYKGTLQNLDLVKTGLGVQILSGTLTGVKSINVQEGTLEFTDKTIKLDGTSLSVMENSVLALADVTITDLEVLSLAGGAVLQPTGDSFSVSVKSFQGDSGTLTWNGSTLGGNLSNHLVSNGAGGYVIIGDPLAVPEPATWLLFLLGSVLLIYKRVR